MLSGRELCKLPAALLRLQTGLCRPQRPHLWPILHHWILLRVPRHQHMLQAAMRGVRRELPALTGNEFDVQQPARQFFQGDAMIKAEGDAESHSERVDDWKYVHQI